MNQQEKERNEKIAQAFDRIWRDLGHEGRRAHIRWLLSRRTRRA